MEQHKPTIINDPILSGKKCPYCNGKTEYIDSKIIYGRSYGSIYICKPCDAYCGVHKGTDIALGRIANAKLRTLKKQAHEFFDYMWTKKMSMGFKKGHARAKAYIWLSKKLETPSELTHIGMFDEEQCSKVIQLCKPFYKQNF